MKRIGNVFSVAVKFKVKINDLSVPSLLGCGRAVLVCCHALLGSLASC